MRYSPLILGQVDQTALDNYFQTKSQYTAAMPQASTEEELGSLVQGWFQYITALEDEGLLSHDLANMERRAAEESYALNMAHLREGPSASWTPVYGNGHTALSTDVQNILSRGRTAMRQASGTAVSLLDSPLVQAGLIAAIGLGAYFLFTRKR